MISEQDLMQERKKEKEGRWWRSRSGERRGSESRRTSREKASKNREDKKWNRAVAWCTFILCDSILLTCKFISTYFIFRHKTGTNLLKCFFLLCVCVSQFCCNNRITVVVTVFIFPCNFNIKKYQQVHWITVHRTKSDIQSKCVFCFEADIWS